MAGAAKALVRGLAGGAVDAQVAGGCDPAGEGGVEFGPAMDRAAVEAQGELEVVLDGADDLEAQQREALLRFGCGFFHAPAVYGRLELIPTKRFCGMVFLPLRRLQRGGTPDPKTPANSDNIEKARS